MSESTPPQRRHPCNAKSIDQEAFIPRPLGPSRNPPPILRWRPKLIARRGETKRDWWTSWAGPGVYEANVGKGRELQKLDVFRSASHSFNAMVHTGHLLAGKWSPSEEEEVHAHPPDRFRPPAIMCSLRPAWHALPCSRNIDVNVSIGTIFSIPPEDQLKRPQGLREERMPLQRNGRRALWRRGYDGLRETTLHHGWVV